MTTPVALVLVSQSRALADATAMLVRQTAGDGVPIVVASGVGDDGGELGTDATRILAALKATPGPAVVLMDLGSAVLSAELALNLAGAALGDRVLLTAAPFVEGAVAAAVAAASGADVVGVAAEARGALGPKAVQLGEAPTRGAAMAAERGTAMAVATIRDPAGLHARPAARLVAAAAAFEATTTIRNLDTGRGPVPATSFVGLGSLGARAGHRLEIAASGQQAGRAVATLARLIATFVGSDDVAPPAASGARPGCAIAVSPGVAVGPLLPLVLLRPEVPLELARDPEAELVRLADAVEGARRDILSASGTGAGILFVQDLLLRDPALLEPAQKAIRDGHRNAADAIASAGAEVAAIYRGLDDPLLRMRHTDVTDAVDRVLRRLLGVPDVMLPGGAPAILLADDLPPSIAATLTPDRVLGVVDRRGGSTSHAAILLRDRSIPAVMGVDGLLPNPPPRRVAFDGMTGELVADPPPQIEIEFLARQSVQRKVPASPQAIDGVARLADGSTVDILANVAGLAEAEAALRVGAGGVGLMRTEMLFLDRADGPSEDEQTATIAAICEVFGERPVVVRVLDAGGDKPIAYMPMRREANPVLGVRGIRRLLREPVVFETQLRAILRAGVGHAVAIMLPMVTDADEVVAARTALRRAEAVLAAAGIPHAWPVPLGVMIEVPAAALAAAQLAEVADFLSIGTNDLTQYVLAAERGHPDLARFADAGHPAVMELVARVAAAGRAAGRPVSVCGEAAGQPRTARLFVEAGIRKLSMGASAIPSVVAALRTAAPHPVKPP